MAIHTRPWTIEDLERLPDDGNKYEVVKGELFVTPTPNPPHESVALRLDHLLTPYVATHRLGYVQHRRALIFMGSEVEPDLTVAPAPVGESWKGAALPILVVEIASRITRRRDRVQKRELYLEAGVSEYWMVDRREMCITVARPAHADANIHGQLEWQPRQGIEPLRFNVAEVFAPFDEPARPAT